MEEHPRSSGAGELESALAWLESHGTKAVRDAMAPKYGIHTERAFGVSMANMKVLAGRLGRSHELADALWETGWYEARMLASMVDEPASVTPEQMDRWCREFDNWAICDTVCFNLFDRTPYAWAKVAEWADEDDEFVKRAAYALLWSLSRHDRVSDDEPFLNGLLLVEAASGDERVYVKKAVNMALRAIGKRNLALNTAALSVAGRLAGSPDPTARWIGAHARKELGSPAVAKRLADEPF